ncbi:MAG TPA: energy transducer TonB, partial [Thermodesulfobacteriota bacterium]|nr:energy transducer TonB [Thermodesulfobacteriota bacterium]
NIIQENITYPARAQRMGWQGKVIIDFIILENGSASNIKIAKSSGFEVLDDNVIKTVESVAPFPKPPVKAELRVPIIYRLE